MCDSTEKLMEEVKEQARFETLVSIVRNLMQSLDMSALQIMDMLHIPDEEREKILDSL